MQRSQRTMIAQTAEKTRDSSSVFGAAALAAATPFLDPNAMVSHNSIVAPGAMGAPDALKGVAAPAISRRKNGLSSREHKKLEAYAGFMIKMRKGLNRYGVKYLAETASDAGTLLDITTKLMDELDSNNTSTYFHIGRDSGKKLKAVLNEAAALVFLESYGIPKKVVQNDTSAVAIKINSAAANLERTLRAIPGADKQALSAINKKETDSILTDKSFASIKDELQRSLLAAMKSYKPPQRQTHTSFSFLHSTKDKGVMGEASDSTWRRAVKSLSSTIKAGRLSRKNSKRLIHAHQLRENRLADNISVYIGATALTKSHLGALDVENTHTANRLAEKKLWTPAADYVFALACNRVQDAIEKRVGESRRALMASWVPEKPLPAESENEVAKFLQGFLAYGRQAKPQECKSPEFYLHAEPLDLISWVYKTYGGKTADAFSDDKVSTVSSFSEDSTSKVTKCQMKTLTNAASSKIWQTAKAKASEKMATFVQEHP